ncbi:MAG TPA: AAA family ATPase [Allocoleopsis sp.]
MKWVMLKKLILENWKSFRYAELPIDPLTVLIGTNASGKSNALEALDFLSRIAHNKAFRESLTGDSTLPPLRGAVEGAVLKSKNQFTVKTLIQGENELTEYIYSITLQILPTLKLLDESLIRLEHYSQANQDSNRTLLFQPNDLSSYNNSLLSFIDTVLPTDARVRNKDLDEGVRIVLKTLRNIFILDPIPSKMRFYSSLSENLHSDASNIAGLLAAIPEGEKKYIEETLASYIKHLPERDIRRVWAEPVGRLQTDAMLYCEEAWVPSEEPTVIDARGMSDGTLRFLAILTALLTRPEGSQLVIEEVDNGLHPSRADLLLKMLREIGEQRRIDILVTTHNPALLNALEPEMLPFVIVAHRDSQTGESKLTPLEDLQNLPKLMASGPLGKLAEQGSIERSLSGT